MTTSNITLLHRPSTQPYNQNDQIQPAAEVESLSARAQFIAHHSGDGGLLNQDGTLRTQVSARIVVNTELNYGDRRISSFLEFVSNYFEKAAIRLTVGSFSAVGWPFWERVLSEKGFNTQLITPEMRSALTQRPSRFEFTLCMPATHINRASEIQDLLTYFMFVQNQETPLTLEQALDYKIRLRDSFEHYKTTFTRSLDGFIDFDCARVRLSFSDFSFDRVCVKIQQDPLVEGSFQSVIDQMMIGRYELVTPLYIPFDLGSYWASLTSRGVICPHAETMLVQDLRQCDLDGVLPQAFKAGRRWLPRDPEAHLAYQCNAISFINLHVCPQKPNFSGIIPTTSMGHLLVSHDFFTLSTVLKFFAHLLAGVDEMPENVPKCRIVKSSFMQVSWSDLHIVFPLNYDQALGPESLPCISHALAVFMPSYTLINSSYADKRLDWIYQALNDDIKLSPALLRFCLLIGRKDLAVLPKLLFAAASEQRLDSGLAALKRLYAGSRSEALLLEIEQKVLALEDCTPKACGQVALEQLLIWGEPISWRTLQIPIGFLVDAAPLLKPEALEYALPRVCRDCKKSTLPIEQRFSLLAAYYERLLQNSPPHLLTVYEPQLVELLQPFIHANSLSAYPCVQEAMIGSLLQRLKDFSHPDTWWELLLQYQKMVDLEGRYEEFDAIFQQTLVLSKGSLRTQKEFRVIFDGVAERLLAAGKEAPLRDMLELAQFEDTVWYQRCIGRHIDEKTPFKKWAETFAAFSIKHVERSFLLRLLNYLSSNNGNTAPEEAAAAFEVYCEIKPTPSQAPHLGDSLLRHCSQTSQLRAVLPYFAEARDRRLVKRCSAGKETWPEFAELLREMNAVEFFHSDSEFQALLIQSFPRLRTLEGFEAICNEIATRLYETDEAALLSLLETDHSNNAKEFASVWHRKCIERHVAAKAPLSSWTGVLSAFRTSSSVYEVPHLLDYFLDHFSSLESAGDLIDSLRGSLEYFIDAKDARINDHVSRAAALLPPQDSLWINFAALLKEMIREKKGFGKNDPFLSHSIKILDTIVKDCSGIHFGDPLIECFKQRVVKIQRLGVDEQLSLARAQCTVIMLASNEGKDNEFSDFIDIDWVHDQLKNEKSWEDFAWLFFSRSKKSIVRVDDALWIAARLQNSSESLLFKQLTNYILRTTATHFKSPEWKKCMVRLILKDESCVSLFQPLLEVAAGLEKQFFTECRSLNAEARRDLTKFCATGVPKVKKTVVKAAMPAPTPASAPAPALAHDENSIKAEILKSELSKVLPLLEMLSAEACKEMAKTCLEREGDNSTEKLRALHAIITSPAILKKIGDPTLLMNESARNKLYVDLASEADVQLYTAGDAWLCERALESFLRQDYKSTANFLLFKAYFTSPYIPRTSFSHRTLLAWIEASWDAHKERIDWNDWDSICKLIQALCDFAVDQGKVESYSKHIREMWDHLLIIAIKPVLLITDGKPVLLQPCSAKPELYAQTTIRLMSSLMMRGGSVVEILSSLTYVREHFPAYSVAFVTPEFRSEFNLLYCSFVLPLIQRDIQDIGLQAGRVLQDLLAIQGYLAQTNNEKTKLAVISFINALPNLLELRDPKVFELVLQNIENCMNIPWVQPANAEQASCLGSLFIQVCHAAEKTDGLERQRVLALIGKLPETRVLEIFNRLLEEGLDFAKRYRSFLALSKLISHARFSTTDALKIVQNICVLISTEFPNEQDNASLFNFLSQWIHALTAFMQSCSSLKFVCSQELMRKQMEFAITLTKRALVLIKDDQTCDEYCKIMIDALGSDKIVAKVMLTIFKREQKYSFHHSIVAAKVVRHLCKVTNPLVSILQEVCLHLTQPEQLMFEFDCKREGSDSMGSCSF